MHQSKNNPHILQEISTNILTKMSDITGSPHWACSEKCKQKKLVTENSVSTVCLCQARIRLSTLALKPRADVTKVQNRGISGPKKRIYVLQIFKKKYLEKVSEKVPRVFPQFFTIRKWHIYRYSISLYLITIFTNFG